MARTPFVAAAATGLVLATAAATLAQDPGEFRRSSYYDYRIVTVAEGLVNPWSMAFLANGDVLVTERPGRLRIIRDGELLPHSVPGVPEVLAEGQGGLLDVVLHPDFSTNRLVYLSYSKPYADEEGATTAVARARFENDRLTDLEDIFVANTRGRGHYGSRLAFDGDGFLFISVGERQVPSTGDLEAHPAQDPTNHHGTINRIHDDGRIPADNPFIGQAGIEPSIWSYGHRNPQGLAIHPESGRLFEQEHGPTGGDEINIIEKGRNYGWPVITYGTNIWGGQKAEGTAKPGMQQPLKYYPASIAPSGMTFYFGARYPAWNGNLFSSTLTAHLNRLILDKNQVLKEKRLLNDWRERVRDVVQGPDELLYLATESGRIVRIVPVQ